MHIRTYIHMYVVLNDQMKYIHFSGQSCIHMLVVLVCKRCIYRLRTKCIGGPLYLHMYIRTSFIGNLLSTPATNAYIISALNQNKCEGL